MAFNYKPTAFAAGYDASSNYIQGQGEQQRQRLLGEQTEFQRQAADKLKTPALSYEDWSAQQSVSEPVTTPEAIPTDQSLTAKGPESYRDYQNQHWAEVESAFVKGFGATAMPMVKQERERQDWMRANGYAINAVKALEQGNPAAAAQQLNIFAESLPVPSPFVFTVDPETGQVVDQDGNPWDARAIAGFTEKNMATPENFTELLRQDTQKEQWGKVFDENVSQYEKDRSDSNYWKAQEQALNKFKAELLKTELYMSLIMDGSGDPQTMEDAIGVFLDLDDAGVLANMNPQQKSAVLIEAFVSAQKNGVEFGTQLLRNMLTDETLESMSPEVRQSFMGKMMAAEDREMRSQQPRTRDTKVAALPPVGGEGPIPGGTGKPTPPPTGGVGPGAEYGATPPATTVEGQALEFLKRQPPGANINLQQSYEAYRREVGAFEALTLEQFEELALANDAGVRGSQLGTTISNSGSSQFGRGIR